jgi:acyl-CoA synthetase (AMP-forming)/AMP-acid ligase II
VRDRIQGFIRACLEEAPERHDVEAQALALWRWQRDHSPSYAAFCGDAAPERLAEIPAVPVGLFRDLPWCCFEPDQARHRFHTSGTTTGHPGVHRLLDCDSYDLASAGWFQACLPQAPTRAISLIPSPTAAPNSSLSHMVGMLYPGASWLAEGGGLVDAERAWALLALQDQPVFVASTALALAALLDTPGEALLPPGSVLMTTGGFKGRSLQVEPAELLNAAAERMGPGLLLVGEYGMTELSSQLWTQPTSAADGGTTPARPFYPPPWLVPVVVDPGSGAPLPPGEPGQLRFVDLANDHSVLAIETMDQGRLTEDGGLILHGRLPGAQARGCSLSVEEALRASRGR